MLQGVYNGKQAQTLAHTLTRIQYTHSHTLYTLPVIHTLAHTSSKKC